MTGSQLENILERIENDPDKEMYLKALMALTGDGSKQMKILLSARDLK